VAIKTTGNNYNTRDLTSNLQSAVLSTTAVMLVYVNFVWLRIDSTSGICFEICPFFDLFVNLSLFE